MSDKELYKILESLSSVTSEDANPYKEVTEADLEENQGTKIEKQGNKVIVTAPTGEKTEFDDEETAAAFMGGEDMDESVNEDWGSSDWYGVIKSMDEHIDKYGLSPEKIRDAARNAAEFWGDQMGHDMSTRDGEQEAIDDCIAGWMRMSERGQQLQKMFAPRESVEKTIEEPVNETEEVNEEQIDEIAPIVGALAGTAARAAGASFGAGAAEKIFGEAELSTFDPEDANHRKRLQRGTPIVLSPELFADPEVDRRAIFISLAPSGQFCKALRNADGREVNCHLSDIMSADILNNSIYEQYNINFESLMEDEQLNEDITITQTTNPDAPENDTMTVTGIGPDAIDELDAIMQNAGLQRDYEAPRDAEVDNGMPAMSEPSAEPVYQPVQVEPEMGPEEPEQLSAGAGCMEDELTEDDLKHLDPELGKAIADGADIYDIMNNEEIPQKDREILQREYDEIAATRGLHPDDDFESIFEIMASDIYDMYGDGNMFGEAERDITHANTPDERVADVKTVTHGTSGGLNKPKRMYRKEYPGDNVMTAHEFQEEEEIAEKAPPGMEDWIKDRKEAFKDQYGDRWEEVLYATAWKEHNKKNEAKDLRPGAALDETESFLNLFKEFQMRGEKRN